MSRVPVPVQPSEASWLDGTWRDAWTWTDSFAEIILSIPIGAWPSVSFERRAATVRVGHTVVWHATFVRDVRPEQSYWRYDGRSTLTITLAKGGQLDGAAWPELVAHQPTRRATPPVEQSSAATVQPRHRAALAAPATPAQLDNAPQHQVASAGHDNRVPRAAAAARPLPTASATSTPASRRRPDADPTPSRAATERREGMLARQTPLNVVDSILEQRGAPPSVLELVTNILGASAIFAAAGGGSGTHWLPQLQAAASAPLLPAEEPEQPDTLLRLFAVELLPSACLLQAPGGDDDTPQALTASISFFVIPHAGEDVSRDDATDVPRGAASLVASPSRDDVLVVAPAGVLNVGHLYSPLRASHGKRASPARQAGGADSGGDYAKGSAAASYYARSVAAEVATAPHVCPTNGTHAGSVEVSFGTTPGRYEVAYVHWPSRCIVSVSAVIHVLPPPERAIAVAAARRRTARVDAPSTSTLSGHTIGRAYGSAAPQPRATESALRPVSSAGGGSGIASQLRAEPAHCPDATSTATSNVLPDALRPAAPQTAAAALGLAQVDDHEADDMGVRPACDDTENCAASVSADATCAGDDALRGTPADGAHPTNASCTTSHAYSDCAAITNASCSDDADSAQQLSLEDLLIVVGPSSVGDLEAPDSVMAEDNAAAQCAQLAGSDSCTITAGVNVARPSSNHAAVDPPSSPAVLTAVAPLPDTVAVAFECVVPAEPPTTNAADNPLYPPIHADAVSVEPSTQAVTAAVAGEAVLAVEPPIGHGSHVVDPPSHVGEVIAAPLPATGLAVEAPLPCATAWSPPFLLERQSRISVYTLLIPLPPGIAVPPTNPLLRAESIALLADLQDGASASLAPGLRRGSPSIVLPERWRPGATVVDAPRGGGSLVEVEFELPSIALSVRYASRKRKEASERDSRVAFRLQLDVADRLDIAKARMTLGVDHIALRLPLYYAGSALPSRPSSVVTVDEVTAVRQAGGALRCRACKAHLTRVGAAIASGGAPATPLLAYVLPSEYWLEWSDFWLCHGDERTTLIPEAEYGAVRGAVLIGETVMQLHPDDVDWTQMRAVTSLAALNSAPVAYHSGTKSRTDANDLTLSSITDAMNCASDAAAEPVVVGVVHAPQLCSVACKNCGFVLGTTIGAINARGIPIPPKDGWRDRLAPDAEPVVRLYKDALLIAKPEETVIADQRASQDQLQQRSNALAIYTPAARVAVMLLSTVLAHQQYRFAITRGVEVSASNSSVLHLVVINWDTSVRSRLYAEAPYTAAAPDEGNTAHMRSEGRGPGSSGAVQPSRVPCGYAGQSNSTAIAGGLATAMRDAPVLKVRFNVLRAAGNATVVASTVPGAPTLAMYEGSSIAEGEEQLSLSVEDWDGLTAALVAGAAAVPASCRRIAGYTMSFLTLPC